MKNLFVTISLGCILVLTGCASKVNMKAYESNPPKRIGVAIGYDVKAIENPSIGTMMLLGAFAALTTEEHRLAFEKDIAEKIWEKVQKDLQRKNYEVELIQIKPKKWKHFEYASLNDEVFPKLTYYYEVDEQIRNYDAILFIEAKIRAKYDDVEYLTKKNIDMMQMEEVMSKIFLYDTVSKEKLFFDCKSDSMNVGSLNEALHVIIALDPLPTVATL